jgi:hypothetical protein
MQENDALGRKFVWTKFGVEAGQPISDIIARKEIERRTNGGTFLWGIGNNIGQSIDALARSNSPEVLFSPIASSPRVCDETPEEVYVWTEAETIAGLPFSIPQGSVVTSRGNCNKRFHYALVCRSDHPLRLEGANEILYAGSLRNLLSGRQVGSSQVTSVVEASCSRRSGRAYQVAMRLRLTPPYFVRLLAPVLVPSKVRRELGDALMRDRAMMQLRGLISASRAPSQARELTCFA